MSGPCGRALLPLCVAAGPAEQPVAPRPAEQAVAPGAAQHTVVTRAGAHDVVAAQRPDRAPAAWAGIEPQSSPTGDATALLRIWASASPPWLVTVAIAYTVRESHCDPKQRSTTRPFT